MKDTALFTQFLGLSVPWRITAITPDLTDKSMTIQIDWPKGTKSACNTCNTLCSVYDHREQPHGDIDAMQFKTRLVDQVPCIHWACRLIQNQSSFKKIKYLITRT